MCSADLTAAELELLYGSDTESDASDCDCDDSTSWTQAPNDAFESILTSAEMRLLAQSDTDMSDEDSGASTSATTSHSPGRGPLTASELDLLYGSDTESDISDSDCYDTDVVDLTSAWPTARNIMPDLNRVAPADATPTVFRPKIKSAGACYSPLSDSSGSTTVSDCDSISSCFSPESADTRSTSDSLSTSSPDSDSCSSNISSPAVPADAAAGQVSDSLFCRAQKDTAWDKTLSNWQPSSGKKRKRKSSPAGPSKTGGATSKVHK